MFHANDVKRKISERILGRIQEGIEESIKYYSNTCLVSFPLYVDLTFALHELQVLGYNVIKEEVPDTLDRPGYQLLRINWND